MHLSTETQKLYDIIEIKFIDLFWQITINFHYIVFSETLTYSEL